MQLYKIKELTLYDDLKCIIPPFTDVYKDGDFTAKIEETAPDYAIILIDKEVGIERYIIYTLIHLKKIRIKGKFGQLETTIELNFSESPYKDSFKNQYQLILNSIAEKIDSINVENPNINSSEFMDILFNLINDLSL